MKNIINKTPTNCVGKCKLHPTLHYCMGCYRTLEHIQNWRDYTFEQKEKILNSKTTDHLKHDDEPRFFTKKRIINNGYY
jgi:predicted Fe-S protein YdhL (DUF1289 family)